MTSSFQNKLLEYIRGSYDVRDGSDVTVEDDSGRKLYLLKFIISQIPYFATSFSTTIGSAVDESRNVIGVESVKTVNPIFKYVYGFSTDLIEKDLTDFSSEELLDFFTMINYFEFADMYGFAISQIKKFLHLILDDDIGHSNSLYSLVDEMVTTDSQLTDEVNLLKSRIVTYIPQNISRLSLDFIGSQLFTKLDKNVQAQIVFEKKSYELMNKHIECINRSFFNNHTSIFEELCSLEQLCYLKSDSWYNIKIVSIYPEFELQIYRKIGSTYGKSVKFQSVFITLDQSSLAVGEVIGMLRNDGMGSTSSINLHKITKIVYNDQDMQKMYVNMSCSVVIGEIYDKYASVYKVKTLSHKFHTR